LGEPESATAASTFRLDVKGGEVRAALAASGVRAVLIKGPALARLLYGSSRSRAYMDVDLLVDPSALARAEGVLARLGFRRYEREAAVRSTDPSLGVAVGGQGSSHATAWLRDQDGVFIDLHDSLPQCGASPNVVWKELCQHLDAATVGGVATETLDRTASALLVALHAAHHGPDWGTTDLDAALGTFDLNTWLAARDLAVTLEADAALGVGLGMTARGREMARELSLDYEPSGANRLQWSGAPWSASVLEALVAERSLRARLAIASRVLWPSPSAMRRGSTLARRGPAGLVAAYVVRIVNLAASLPAALRARRRASRTDSSR
jgi:hypothetical protein